MIQKLQADEEKLLWHGSLTHVRITGDARATP